MPVRSMPVSAVAEASDLVAIRTAVGASAPVTPVVRR